VTPFTFVIMGAPDHLPLCLRERRERAMGRWIVSGPFLRSGTISSHSNRLETSLKMTLVACPDCGASVSARAPICPNCGCPVSSIQRTAATKRAVLSGYGMTKRWIVRSSSFFGTHWVLSYFLVLALVGLVATGVRLQTLPVDAERAPHLAGSSMATGIGAALHLGFWSDRIESTILSTQYKVDPNYRLPDLQSSEWATLESGLDTSLLTEYGSAVSRENAQAIRTILLKKQAFYRQILDRPENDRVLVFLIATEIELVGTLWLPISLLSLLSAAVSRRAAVVDAAGARGSGMGSD
jgi:hypothetical protein